jgi:hypothetical protein
MMRSGSAVHTKGFGLLLCSAGGLKVDEGMKDAALQAAAGELGKKPSSALSQEAEVG